ncbi:hypothetical protein [Halalkalibacter sp. APA_J-10(15)]|uniref:hypothetical protein n=1 Tax=Halalkalibacter sp. APA_J-10(15) TaxID=2933805 RepID=UPI001FF503AF|nr:hypothetical protein [Halalkalibacter sp. APA_J-10(15)]MCK0472788.1 hypothetical protein [Halalkalibacter sp. APA_J-10(15)]
MEMWKRSMLLVGLCMVFILAACGGESTVEDSSDPEQTEEDTDMDSHTDEDEAIRIGVQIYDATDSEVVAFKRYYEDYIEDHYNVEFLFSESINTAEEEVTSTENFINQGVDAIISFSDQDRMAVIRRTEDAGVHYAIAAGTLSDEQYDQVKDNEYFVGSIGPSLEQEEQIGYDMAKHYLDEGYTNFLLYAGGYPYVDMHQMRTSGMIRAFEEAGVAYTPREDGQFGEFSGDGFTINTIAGFPDDSGAFFGTAGERVSETGLEVVLTAALGLEFFGTPIAQSGSDIQLATVSSFTEAYKGGFEAGQVDYLAGKFASSIGPIFAAVYNAVNGDEDVARQEGGAFRLDQGYWVATTQDEFNEMYTLSNSIEEPAYTDELLNTVIKRFNEETTYQQFADLVESYEFSSIQEMLGE